ncbi:mechanosensitive ion channel protein [Kitasatospora sp. MMS16-BH015]|nr:mechanosensitive ion channel protein [Kitasatospora sp. MMS16-BH015]
MLVRPLATLLGILVVTLALGWGVDQVLQRVAARRPADRVWPLLRRCRVPLQVVIAAGLLLGTRPIERLFDLKGDGTHHAVLLVLIAGLGWLTVRVVAAGLVAFLSRYEGRWAEDPARLRRVHTQTSVLRRVVSALIAVVTAAVMLLTFDAMRTIGTSLLASAGILGIVAGIAAQSALGNFFAGLQIAFGDTVRIGDTVVVDTQQGTVEEITLTYLVIRLWDYRRLIVPVSYFVSKPFENWTRRHPGLLAWVVLHLDHTTPVPELRAALHSFLETDPHWDGEEWSLQVTDTTPSTLVVRAAMTARTPDEAALLRFEVREHLVAYLRDTHPAALPRLRTGEGTEAGEDGGKESA